MAVFRATITLEDIRGKQSRMPFDLGDFGGTPDADFPSALAALGQIEGALSTITNATVRKSELVSVVTDDAATAGAGDLTERGMVNVYLDAAGDKVTQVYVPAPIQGIFIATQGKGYDVIDVADADLVQYVQQLSQHARVSDGETIDTTVQNGIDSGKRVTRNLKLG